MTAAKKGEGGQEITQPMFRVVTESPREILTTVAVCWHFGAFDSA